MEDLTTNQKSNEMDSNLAQGYNTLSQIILGLPGTHWPELFSKAAANPLLNFNIEKTEYSSIDELEAEHYDLFGLTVYPYRNFFLDFEGKFSGEESADLISYYQKNNFDFEKETSGAGPTHLGVQLKFLSELKSNSARKEFLERFVFDWVFPFQFAVEDASQSVFSKAVRSASAIMLQDWKILNGCEEATHFELKLPEFTQIDEFLNNKDTSLNEIGEYLLKPAYCGMYISRHLIKKMAADLQVPVGFGERRTIFSNLLQTSSRFDHWTHFLEMLSGELSRWKVRYEAIDKGLNSVAGEWMKAIERSQYLVNKLKTMSFDQQ